MGFELRAGTHHTALESHSFYERVFPRIKRLVAPDKPVLTVEDSGFDSARLLFAKAQQSESFAAEGRRFEFITKRKPRRQDKTAWVAAAEAAGAFHDVRPGKRVGVLDLAVERAWGKEKRPFRLIVEVTERTIDRKGQHRLVPGIELAGGWTSLTLPAAEVIEHYRSHGTHEQFHAELFGCAESFAALRTATAWRPAPCGLVKSDLDLERLPSGKFDTNDAILHLGAFADNCLRLIGQLGLTGEIAPTRHPAKRRRLKTVLQGIMYRAAKFVEYARRLILDFGRNFAEHVKVFVALHDRLLRSASP